MNRSKTPSFILTLKLNTSASDEYKLAKRFYRGRKIYNALVRHLRKSLASMRQDRQYKDLLKLYISDKSSKEIKQKLSDLREAYGLSEFSLHEYVKKLQDRYAKDIDSLSAQKIASQAWRSARAVIFGNGKIIHFCKLNDFSSIEGKNNASGMRFKGGKLNWNGIVVQPHIKKNDAYARKALLHRVKYCRVMRKISGDRYGWYLQLILEGTPPIKHQAGNGRGGIDIGTSTLAVVTKGGCTLKVLANEAEDIERKKAVILRKIDRSRRSMNPDNYNKDGTVKKGKKHWVKSNTYKKTERRYKKLCAKRAAVVKQSHEKEANRLVSQANIFYVESMNFKALSKRAAKTVYDSKGKAKQKSRFGKSIGNRAPAMFLEILERKLKLFGGELIKINTVKFKASQYDHIANRYKKKKLSQRWANVGSGVIQRDLYSAFLLMNSNEEGTSADRMRCIKTYRNFKKQHDALIIDLENSKQYLPQSFGIKKAI